MIAVIRWLAGCVVLLTTASASLPVASSAQPPAAAPSNPGELYVADVGAASPDLGLSSSIVLQPGGRFEWRLTMGLADVSARGTWDRDGDMLHLNNPEQVGAPALALAGTARDAGVVLRVQLEPATARMASVLEAELEYPGDRFARAPLGDGPISLPAGEPRPIAVRLMSETFSLRTEPVAIAPGGDNVLTLRLTPADFGQAFFGSQQVRFDARGMTLDWRGIALRYNRAPAAPAGS